MTEIFHETWQLLLQFVDIFLHLDAHLSAMAASLGPWLYVVLFLVIFAETGLVITPFLPGDSLLFAVGALSALDESNLNFWLIMGLLIIAAILGDAVNYSIGRRIGKRVYSLGDRWWVKQAHLEKTRDFYDRYGGKTIVLARFVPIIRTFAPFVAGVGEMSYRRFSFYNVSGGIFWVVSFLSMGYYFGNLPSIKSNFHYVIVGIIFISILPGVWAYLSEKKKSRHKAIH